MNKDVFARFALNETKAFGIVEPLYSPHLSIRHVPYLVYYKHAFNARSPLMHSQKALSKQIYYDHFD